MGCDIHLNVEMVTKKNDQYTSWSLVQNELCVLNYGSRHYVNLGWGEGRNYNTFAMMANVRNYSSYENREPLYEPMSEPKGTPKDMSEELSSLYCGWGGDAHSASYFTLKELVDFKNNGYFKKTVKHVGKVMIAEFDDYWNEIIESKKGNDLVLKRCPNSYASCIYNTPHEIYNIEFYETYEESAGFLINLIDNLQSMVEDSFYKYAFNDCFYIPKHDENLSYEENQELKYENVRIVFWFDN
jgi:hypothetical protein